MNDNFWLGTPRIKKRLIYVYIWEYGALCVLKFLFDENGPPKIVQTSDNMIMWWNVQYVWFFSVFLHSNKVNTFKVSYDSLKSAAMHFYLSLVQWHEMDFFLGRCFDDYLMNDKNWNPKCIPRNMETFLQSQKFNFTLANPPNSSIMTKKVSNKNKHFVARLFFIRRFCALFRGSVAIIARHQSLEKLKLTMVGSFVIKTHKKCS